METIRLETRIDEIDGIKILDLAGEIDVYTAPQFKESVNQIIDGGQNHLVINMERLSYMDSSGFATLLSATRRLRPNNGSVKLVKCSPAIDRILRITRLNTIFELHDDLHDAVRLAREAQRDR